MLFQNILGFLVACGGIFISTVFLGFGSVQFWGAIYHSSNEEIESLFASLNKPLKTLYGVQEPDSLQEPSLFSGFFIGCISSILPFYVIFTMIEAIRRGINEEIAVTLITFSILSLIYFGSLGLRLRKA